MLNPALPDSVNVRPALWALVALVLLAASPISDNDAAPDAGFASLAPHVFSVANQDTITSHSDESRLAWRSTFYEALVEADIANNGSTAASGSYTVSVAPSLSSILRSVPSSDSTSADTLTWQVSFSGPVRSVDPTDFAVSGTTATVRSVTANADSSGFSVEVYGGDLNSLNGTVGLSLSSSEDITNAAGQSLSSTTGTLESYELDNTAPGLSITLAPATDSDSVIATFTFTESITGFTSDDISVTGGVKGSFTTVTTNSVWALSIAATGTVDVSVAANAATDQVGLSSTAASGSYTVSVAPSLSSILRSVPSSDSTSADTLTWQVSFSGPVRSVDPTDFAVSGTTATVRSVTANADSSGFSVEVYGGDLNSLNGTVGLSLSSSEDITNAAGQSLSSTTGTLESYELDNTAPGLSITLAPATDSDSVIATFTFTESITGFTSDDISVTGGVKGSFTTVTTNSVWALSIAATGTVDVSVAANAATDQVGLSSTAASGSYTVSVAPSLSSILRSVPSSDSTSADTLTWQVSFSGPVRSVDPTDFAVSGTTATVRSVTANADSSGFSVEVYGGDLNSLNGTVGLSLSSSEDITNAAGQSLSSTTGTLESYELDNTAPGLSITLAPATDSDSVIATFTFTESITGFTSDDISVTGGVKGSFTTVTTNSVWALSIAATGTVDVSVAANAATDQVGLSSTAASGSYTVSVAPSLSSILRSVPSSDSTSADTLTWQVSFSGPVRSVDPTDFAVSGTTATVRSVTANADSSGFSVEVYGGDLNSLNGTVGLSLSSSEDITNAAGQSLSSTTGTLESYELDNTAPGLSITLAPATDSDSVIATFTFTESITGFTSDDISVTGGVKGSFTTVTTNSVWALSIAATGTVDVSVAANAATDQVGLSSTAASGSYTVSVAPSLSSILRSVPSSDSTSADTLTWQVSFSGPVRSVDPTDFAVSGTTATVRSVTANADSSGFSVEVYGGDLNSLNGTVGLSLSSSEDITNAAGQSLSSTTGTLESYELDNTAPGLSITLAPATDSDSVIATFTFTESITGFTSDDISVTGGVKGSFTTVTTNSVWALSIAATGTVDVSVAANAATDQVGLSSTAASGSYTVSVGLPKIVSVTHRNPTTSPTNQDHIRWRVTFSEPVVNVDVNDFVVSPLNRNGLSIGIPEKAANGTWYNVRVAGNELKTYTGPVTLSLALGHDIVDADGNALVEIASPDPAQWTFMMDNTAPEVDMTLAKVTGEDSLLLTLTFDESVTGLDKDEIEVKNQSQEDVDKGTFESTTADLAWTLKLGLSENVTVTLPANAVTDLAGNGNALTQETFEVSVAPTVVSITRDDPTSERTNANALTWQVTFSEPVVNVDVGDFVVDGTTATAASVTTDSDGTAYRVQVSGGDLAGVDGTVSLSLSSVQDIVDQSSAALSATTPSGVHQSYIVDNTAPVPTLTFAPATHVDSVVVTIDFGESVTGFTKSDVTGISDQDKGTFVPTTPDQVWALTMLATASVTVTLPEAAAADLATNGSAAVSEPYIPVGLPKIVSVTHRNPTTSPTNQDHIRWRVTFSEPVVNVDVNDFVVSPLNRNGLSIGIPEKAANGTWYNVRVAGNELKTYTGPVTLSLALGQDIVDADGNALVEIASPDPAQWTFMMDNTAPEVDMTLAKVTGEDSLLLTLTFDESVTGLDKDEIEVKNQSQEDVDKGTFESTTADLAWTLKLGLSETVTVTLPANAVTDLAGNGNALTQETFEVSVAPTVVSITRDDPTSERTNANALTWQVTFSEPVVNVDVGDFVVDGTTATAASVTTDSDGTAYRVQVSGGDLAGVDGTVSLSLSSVQDIVDQSSAALSATTPSGVHQSYIVDNTAPVPTLSFAPATHADSVVVTIDFGESVTGFTKSDVTGISDQDKGTFVPTTPDQVWALTMLATASVTVTLPEAAAADLATNGSAAVSEPYIPVGLPKIVSVTHRNPTTSPTNQDHIRWRVTFSEPVVNVDVNDFVVSPLNRNGLSIGIPEKAANGTWYQVRVAGNELKTYTGPVTLSLALGHDIVDADGNALVEIASPDPAQWTFMMDNTAPEVDMTLAKVTGEDSLLLTLTFDESVTGLDKDEIEVKNQSQEDVDKGTFESTTADLAWTLKLGLSENVTVTLPANAVTDLAGNGNALTQETFEVSVAPTVVSITRDDPTSERTNANALTWQVTFSEPVVNVDVGDFVVDGTTATAASVTTDSDGTAYRVQVSGGDLAGVDGTVSLSLSSVQDIVDQSSAALSATTPSGVHQSYIVDNTAPVPTLTFAPATHVDSVVVTIDFGESVTGFTKSDVTGISDQDKGTFVPTTPDQVWALTMLATASVTVTLPEAAAADLATNGSAAVSEPYIPVGLPKIVSVTHRNPTTSPTNQDHIRWRVTFSEPVFNVDVSDFVVSPLNRNGLSIGIPEKAANGTWYNVRVAGNELKTYTGPVTLSLALGHDIVDADGNALVEIASPDPAQWTFMMDNTAPEVDMTLAKVTGEDSLLLTLTFDESVTGLDKDEIEVKNQSQEDVDKGTFESTTADLAWTLKLGLSENVTVTLPANAVTDLAGNGNALTQETFEVSVAPTVVSITRDDPTSERTNANALTWQVTFSEPVVNVDVGDFVVDGTTATAASVTTDSDGTAYRVQVSGGDLAGVDGTVSLSLSSVQDIVDQSSAALSATTPSGVHQSYIVDNTAPVPTLSFAPATHADSVVVTIDFGESVTGFTKSDVTGISDQDKGTFVPTTPDQVWALTMLATASVTVTLPEAAAADLATNGSAAVSEPYIPVGLPKIVSVTHRNPTTSPTNQDHIRWRVTFSEPVVNVDVNDFVVSPLNRNGLSIGIPEKAANGTWYQVRVAGNELKTYTGPVTLSLALGHDIVDADGNALVEIASPDPAQWTFMMDNTAPEVDMTLAKVTGEDSLLLTLTFDESVTGLDKDEIEVKNQSQEDVDKGTFESTTADLAWTLKLGLSENVTVTLPANAVTDLAGNGNALTQETFEVSVAPTVVSITRDDPTSERTNANALTWQVTFSEPVVNVDVGDFVVDGTTATAASVTTDSDGTAYRVQVSGGDLAGVDGTVSLSLSSVQDIVDQSSAALSATTPSGVHQSYIVDNTAPVPTLTFAPATHVDSVVVTIDFGESVTGFTKSDVTGISDQDKGTFVPTTPDQVWALTMLATASVTVTLPEAAAADLATNGSAAVSEPYIPVGLPKIVSVTHRNPTTSPTNQDHIRWRVTFSEPVFNVDVSDFVVSPLNRNGLSIGIPEKAANGTWYNVRVAGNELKTYTGPVTLSLALGHDIVDADGNALVEIASPDPAQWTFMMDNTAPEVDMTLAKVTGEDSLLLTLTFDESVTGLDKDEIEVKNQSQEDVDKGTFESTTADLAWTLKLGLSENVTVTLPANAVTDLAGNGNALTQETFEVSVAPTVVSITRDDPTSERTNANALTWQVTFSEPVVNVDVGDFVVDGTTATAASVTTDSDGTAYRVQVSGGDLAGVDGTVSLSLSSVQDIVDQSSAALSATTPSGVHQSYIVDNTAPVPTLTFAPATHVDSVVVTIDFGESVTGFTKSDVTGISDQDKGTFVPTTPDQVWALTMLATASVTVTLPEAAAADLATNGSAAVSEPYIPVGLPKIVSVTHRNPTTSPTNQDHIRWRVTFSEPVVNVDVNDFVVSPLNRNGLSIGIPEKAANGTWYNVRVAGNELKTYTGPVTLSLALGHDIVDADGNALVEIASPDPAQWTFMMDNTAPEVDMTLAKVTGEDSLLLTLTFDESVTGLDKDEIEVKNQSQEDVDKGTFESTTADLAWTLKLGLSENVTVTLPANAVTDLAGNGNALTQETFEVSVAPTVVSITRDDPTSERTNANALTWQVTFSEPVVNVDVGDFVVDGTTATAASVTTDSDGTAYRVQVSGGDLAGVDGTVSLSLSSVQDIVDQSSAALSATTPSGVHQSYIVDNTAPVPTLTFAPATHVDSVVVTIDFGESVTGFTKSDVTGISDQDKGTFVPTTPDQVWALTMLATASVTVTLPEAAAADLATNGSAAVSEPYIPVGLPKIVSVTHRNPTTSPTNQDHIRWRVTFSEPVVNVDVNDFVVSPLNRNGLSIGIPEKAANGTWYNVRVAGNELKTYTGPVTLSLALGQDIVDADGNALVEIASPDPAQWTFMMDNTAPEVDMTLAKVTGEDSLLLTLTFDESVTGLDKDEIEVKNQSQEDVDKGTFESTTADLAWTLKLGLSETVTVTLPANAVTDLAGNGNALTQETFEVSVAPTLTMMLTQKSTAGHFEVEFDWSDDVTGFDREDVKVYDTSQSPRVEIFDVLGDLNPDAGNWTALLIFHHGSEFSFEVCVDLAGVNDAAGNPIGIPNEEACVPGEIDTTPPSVEITLNSSPASSNYDFEVTFTWSDDVTQFDSGDVTVENTDNQNSEVTDLTWSYVSGPTENSDGDNVWTYTLDFDADSDFDFKVCVENGAVSDDAGNPYEASDDDCATDEIDTVAPEVTIALNDDHATADFEVTFTWSDDVTQFDSGDVTVENTDNQNSEVTDLTWSYVSGPTQNSDGDNVWTYTLDFDADSDFDFRVCVEDGAVSDDAGNPYEASDDDCATDEKDTAAPEVTIALNDDHATADFEVTFTWSDDVSQFDSGNVTVENTDSDSEVTGLTWSYVSGPTENSDGDNVWTYTLDFDPDSDFDFKVCVENGAVSDDAGNPYEASDADCATDEIDTAAPEVTIALNDNHATADFEVTFTWSDDVSQFDSGDVTVENTDNQNSEVTDLTWSYVSGPTQNSDGDNVWTYTLDFDADSDFDFKVCVENGAVSDDAGNPYEASDDDCATDEIDTAAPEVTIALNDNHATADFEVTFTWSDDVTQFDSGDVTVENTDNQNSEVTDLTWSYVSGPTENSDGDNVWTYTLDFDADSDFDFKVCVENGAVSDDAGNPYEASDDDCATDEIDTVAPEVTIALNDDHATADFEVTFTWSDDVTQFDSGDVTVENTDNQNSEVTDLTWSYVSGPTQNSDGDNVWTYTLDFDAGSDFDFKVCVEDGAVSDDAGNLYEASDDDCATDEIDNVAPEVTIALNDDHATADFEVTFTWSDDVTGFDREDVKVYDTSQSPRVEIFDVLGDLNPDAGNWTALLIFHHGSEFTFEVCVDLAGVNDAAGNPIGIPNEEACVPGEIDTAAPEVTIALNDNHATADFEVTFTWSDDVTTFDSGVVTVENTDSDSEVADTDLTWSYVSGPTETDNVWTYTLDFDGDSDFNFEVCVENGAVSDEAGNLYEASDDDCATDEIDTAAPEVTIALNDNHATADFEVTFTWSDDVSQFDSGNVTVENTDSDSEVTGLTWSYVSGPTETDNVWTYTLDFDPDSDFDFKVCVEDGAVSDDAGNPYEASDADCATDEIDTAAPEVDIALNDDHATADFGVTFTWSDDVSQFDSGDVTVENTDSDSEVGDTDLTWSYVSGPTETDNVWTYTLDFDGDSDFNFKVCVEGGAVSDEAGNLYEASDDDCATDEIDTAAPEVTIALNDDHATADFEVTFTWSDDVSQFDSGNVTVENTDSDSEVTGLTWSYVSGPTETDNVWTYTLDFDPDSDFDFKVCVENGAVSDDAGNPYEASDDDCATDEIDTAAPEVTIALNDDHATADFEVTFTWSDDVSQFDSGNVTVENTDSDSEVTGLTWNYVSGPTETDNVWTYTLDFDPDSDFDFKVCVENGAVSDDAGNPYEASDDDCATDEIDTAAPEVTIALNDDHATADFEVTFTWSDDVSQFDSGNVTVENTDSDSEVTGLTWNYVSGPTETDNVWTYTLDFDPDSDFDFKVCVENGAVSDDAGNPYEASDDDCATDEIDTAAPEVTIALNDNHATADFEVTFTWSDDVSQFDSGNVTVENTDSDSEVTGLTWSYVSGPTETDNVWTYTLDFDPDSDFDFKVCVEDGEVSDDAGNPYEASDNDCAHGKMDNVAPEVYSVTRSGSYRTSATTLYWTVNFTESVTVASGNFSVSGPSNTSIDVTSTNPSSSHTVKVSGGNLANYEGLIELSINTSPFIVDGSDNSLISATPTNQPREFSYFVDRTNPTLGIVRGPGNNPTKANTLVWKVIFSEVVTGVSPGKFSVSLVNPTDPTDPGGFGAAASGPVQLNCTNDDAETPNNVDDDFTKCDATYSGSNIANHNGTARLVFSDNTPVVKDLVNKPLSPSTPNPNEPWTLDNQSATITSIVRESPSKSPTNATSATWEFTFDEKVQSVDAADMKLTFKNKDDDFPLVHPANAPSCEVKAAGNTVCEVTFSDEYVSVNGNTYSLATWTGWVEVGLVNGGAGITDEAGNSGVSKQATPNDVHLELDHSRPTVTLAGTGLSTTIGINDVLTVLIAFSEDVTQTPALSSLVVFDPLDLTGTPPIAATSIAPVNGSQSQFHATLTPSSLGHFIVQLVSGAVQDAAGNTSVSSNQLTGEVSTIVPHVGGAGKRASSSPVRVESLIAQPGVLAWEVRFTAPVQGVDASDFTLIGSADELAVHPHVDPAYYVVSASESAAATLSLAFAPTAEVTGLSGTPIADFSPVGTHTPMAHSSVLQFTLPEGMAGPLPVGTLTGYEDWSLVSDQFELDPMGQLHYVGTGEDYEGGPGAFALMLTQALDSVRIRVEVTDVNEAPQLPPAYRFDLLEETAGPVRLGALVAVDPEGDSLQWQLSGSPEFQVDADGAVSYLGEGVNFESDPTAYTLAVVVSDPAGLQAEAPVMVTVKNRNEAPRLTQAISSWSLERGVSQTRHLTELFVDPDGDTLSYVVEVSPPTLADAVLIGGALTVTGQQLGTGLVMLTATDPEGRTVSGEATLVVEASRSDREEALAMSLSALGQALGANTVEMVTQRLRSSSSSWRLGGERLCGTACGMDSWVRLGARLSGIPTSRSTTSERRRAPTAMKASELLSRSAFERALPRGWSIWGQGQALRLANQSHTMFGLRGRTLGGFGGVDYRWSRGHQAGVSLQHTRGQLQMTTSPLGAGSMEVQVTQVTPYARWVSRSGLSVWGLWGLGPGETTLWGSDEGAYGTRLWISTLALGVRQEVHKGFALEADAFQVDLRSEATVAVAATSAQARRVRILPTWQGAWGAWRTRWSVAARWDESLILNGLGAEALGQLGYRAGGVSIEGQARTLLWHHAGSVREWGASVQVRWAPPRSGFTMALRPMWGAAQSRARTLWSSGLSSVRSGSRTGESLQVEGGYVHTWRSGLKVQPYGRWRQGTMSSVAVGTRWTWPLRDLPLQGDLQIDPLRQEGRLSARIPLSR